METADDRLRFAQAELEDRIGSFATRYGFRPKDFHLTWDGAHLDPSRTIHELVITTQDGRRAEMAVSHETLLARDPWTHVRDIEAALSKLQRRTGGRGE